jgi:hypothetical protein
VVLVSILLAVAAVLTTIDPVRLTGYMLVSSWSPRSRRSLIVVMTGMGG